MRYKILFLIILGFCSIVFAEENSPFIPRLSVGDRWMIKREMGESKTQYWKYEVVSSISIDEQDYFVIFISSDDVQKSLKLIIQGDKFILKEITETEGDNSLTRKMEEVIAPVIETKDYSHLYDLPAFPLTNPAFAEKNLIVPESGGKRIRVIYRRRNYSQGDVVTSELMRQDTERIGIDKLKSYSRLEEKDMKKIDKDGYFIVINGEKRRIKQIWVENIPWWIYNESVNERDYLMGYYSGKQ